MAAKVGTKNVLCTVGRRCCSCSVYKEKTVRSCLTTKDTVKKKEVFYEKCQLVDESAEQKFAASYRSPSNENNVNTVTG